MCRRDTCRTNNFLVIRRLKDSGSYPASPCNVQFVLGETAKTVRVPVLGDTHDEGSETLTLALSAPFGAALSDAEATGTIVNTGPMPGAWVTRFGRTVALQAVEAIGARVDGAHGAAGAHVVVGGVELAGVGGAAGALLDGRGDSPVAAGAENRPSPLDDTGAMSGRELWLGSSFRLATKGEDGAPAWTAWGRFATSGFDGKEPGLSLSGDVTTGFLGADASLERGLAGVAVGVSEGEGSFRDDAGDDAGDGAGTVESSLTSVFPYGLRPPMGRGVLTPYAGVSMAGGARTLRIGARWNAAPAFALALEASRGAADGDGEPATAAALRAAYRW